MTTISGIEDFRNQFEMFAVYSLLLAVNTNNYVGNKWTDTDLHVYSKMVVAFASPIKLHEHIKRPF